MFGGTLDTLHFSYLPGKYQNLPVEIIQPHVGNKVRLPVNRMTIPKFTGVLHPQWFDSAHLVWEPDPSWVSPVYDIWRGESPEGPFIKLTQQPVAGNQYTDPSFKLASKYYSDWYLVQVWLGDVSIGFSAPITHENELSPWHFRRKQEINRREWIILSRFNGVPSMILKRVQPGKYGYRCSRCWDPTRRMVTDDHCPVCFGTSYEMGYYNGIRTYVNYSDFQSTDYPMEEGRWENAARMAWTIAYPKIDPNDLLVHIPERRVYRVDNLSSTLMRTVPVKQNLQIIQLPPTAVEYLLLNREGV